MATTINIGFQGLRENLEITGLQSSTVSTRQTNVRDNLAKEMTVDDSFLVGSYQRNTMVSPLSDADVDIFMVMNVKYYEQNGQASILDKVKKALSKSYTTSDISRNGQAVTIRFTDFRVDVVPAFTRPSGGYFIPDSVGKRWISTNPKTHITLWSDLNKTRDSAFIPLVKMIKGWNKSHSSKFRSFHLECVARNVFNLVAINDYTTAVKYFFDQARWNFTNVSDPAGYGGNVADYLDTQGKKDEIITRLEAAATKAKEAIDFATAGKISSAFDKWRVIFGDYFPKYG
jgi:hypothetical protein